MISVIVPVYNTEAYLPRCIESVLSQTITDYELLLINDGSTDGSEAICREYESKHPKIKVVSQGNGGVSSARNHGIQNSRGEFIMFLDADDYLDPSMMETLLQQIGEYDFCICGYRTVNTKDDTINTKSMHEYAGTCFPKDFAIYAEIKENVLLNSPCNKLFRRSRIRNGFDPSVRMGEDLLFCLDYLENCNSVKVISQCLYNYVYRPGSATKLFQTDRVENELRLFAYEKRFVEHYFESYDMNRISGAYARAIRNCYLALQGTPFCKQKILTVLEKWKQAIMESGFMEFSSDGTLDFVTKSVDEQYAHTLREYGYFRKIAKRFLFEIKRS